MAEYRRDLENSEVWGRERRRMGICALVSGAVAWAGFAAGGNVAATIAVAAAIMAAIFVMAWLRLPWWRRMRYTVSAWGVLEEYSGGSGRWLRANQIRGYVAKRDAIVVLGRTVAGIRVPADLEGMEGFRRELEELGARELPEGEARTSPTVWLAAGLCGLGVGIVGLGHGAWMLAVGVALLVGAAGAGMYMMRRRTDVERWRPLLVLALTVLPIVPERLHWHKGPTFMALGAASALLLLEGVWQAKQMRAERAATKVR